MVQRIKNIQEIKWYDTQPPLREENLILLKDFPFKLPKLFIELLKISDGGYIDYIFDYYDHYFNKTLSGSIGQIYGISIKSSQTPNRLYDPEDSSYFAEKEYHISYNNIIDIYNNPTEYFPENLVIFGRNGGGDKICFDYRADPSTDNPPVVYWLCGWDEGEDISFLANNFEEFLGVLKEPEEDEEFWESIKK